MFMIVVNYKMVIVVCFCFVKEMFVFFVDFLIVYISFYSIYIVEGYYV